LAASADTTTRWTKLEGPHIRLFAALTRRRVATGRVSCHTLRVIDLRVARMKASVRALERE